MVNYINKINIINIFIQELGKHTEFMVNYINKVSTIKRKIDEAEDNFKKVIFLD